jgi:GntP family gluconate:H+ symporter
VSPLLLLAIGMLVVIGGILVLKLHPFLALVLGALAVAALTPPSLVERAAIARGSSPAAARQLAQQTIGERVADGFGRTAGQIGIMIAAASIIGTTLLESGSADRIVRSTVRALGQPRAPMAFLSSGFVLGIPVFFDTVFYLMVPLAKAMWARTRAHYLLYVLAICTGATMTHSLVPPTPGPLFVAAELKVDMGLMILGGIAVGAVVSAAGYAHALWLNRKYVLPVRGTGEAIAQLEELALREDRALPPLWIASLPIVLPVVLLSGNSILTAAGAGGTRLAAIVSVLGDRNIALLIGAAIGLFTMLAYTSRTKTLAGVHESITSGGVIILITSAGGAFGAALQQTGIATTIQQLASAYQLPVLPLAWLLTVLVRTAQGSATVAMITAAGIMSGFAASGQLAFHPMYLALAIGCGSKPIWWMNDSGFWVVTQMSGMTERESLRTITPMSVTMGVAGLAATMIGAWLWPLV